MKYVLGTVGAIAAVGIGAVVVALSVAAPRKAEAQTKAGKYLIMGGGGSPQVSVPLNGVRVGRFNMGGNTPSGYYVQVSGKAPTEAVMYTCNIKFATISDAMEFAELLQGSDARQLECRGPFGSISTNAFKWKELDSASNDFAINGAP